MTSRLSCDENGFLKGFPYHDGFLDGVLAGGTEVHLALRSSRSERRVLTLRRVVMFHVEGFREGNIVLNLRLLRADQVASDAEVRRILADRLFFDPAKLGADSSVFLLEASFGAEVVAICGEVEISEVGVTLALSRGAS
ncbi:hypothetical protein [Cystobacter fuscus]|uniref:hypothetical protein n=1 Tax=Cystobacter fuscus TaxID=43 RepID=UPI0012FD4547|nr:hypothetical protein [Cystobacter fuscus]